MSSKWKYSLATMAVTSTPSLVVLTLLFIASVTRAAAIMTTAGMPLKTGDLTHNETEGSWGIGQQMWETTQQSPSVATPHPQFQSSVRNDDAHDADEEDIWTAGSGNAIRVTRPYKSKIKEYGKHSSKVTFTEVLEKTETLAPIDSEYQVRTGNTLLEDGKSRCAFQSWPVGPDYEHIKRKNPDPLTLHLEAVKAEQDAIGMALSVLRDLPEANLPDGCTSDQNWNIVCSGKDFTGVPEFKIRKVNEINFINTAIAHVDQENVDNLPRTITRLSFHDGILTIFDGRNLKYIDGLETLSLARNAIAGWSFAKNFEDDGNPCCNNTIKYMDLKDNYLSYPPDPVKGPPVLPYLETIGMNNNPICYLPGKLFEPLVNSPVKRLYLKNCSICDFSGDPLSHLPNLEVLDLSANIEFDITKIAELLEPLSGGHLKELYLANNNYVVVPTEALAKVNGSLEILDLHASAFETLDNTSFPFMPQLLRLNLMYSRISSIQENTFEGFTSLLELNLDGNGLLTVPSAVLLPSLQILTIAENPRLTGSDMPNTFSLDNVNFTKMTNLLKLTLDQVPLTLVKTHYFNALHSLKELTLNGCHIQTIEPFSFQNLAMLEKLWLHENLLTVLLNDTFTGLSNLRLLDLTDNLISFFSHDIVTPKSTIKAEVYSNDHDHVSHLRNINSIMAKNPSGSLFEWLTGIRHRLNIISLYAESTDNSPGGSDFGQQPLINLPFANLTRLVSLSLTSNQIKRLFPDVFDDLKSVEEIDLSSNQIREWHAPVFQNCDRLTSLSLEKNSMTYLTDAMVDDFSLESVETINLMSNEFVCNCSLLKFNESLDPSVFSNYPSYVCLQGNTVYNLSQYIEQANCPSPPETKVEPGDSDVNVKLIVLVTSSAVIVFLLVSLGFYKKRWYIRYIMYSMKAEISVYEKDEDDYVYDTFVCYSQTDRQWVFEHLLPKIEDVERLRVCVHERDFTVGQEITENIINCVEKSRKVIVVLTPSFVASSWCMFELQMASNKILDERKCKLILVLLESIPVKIQPKKLKLLLKTRTYIAWEKADDRQKVFWARLMRSLSKPSDTETVPSISSSIVSESCTSDHTAETEFDS